MNKNASQVSVEQCRLVKERYMFYLTKDIKDRWPSTSKSVHAEHCRQGKWGHCASKGAYAWRREQWLLRVLRLAKALITCKQASICHRIDVAMGLYFIDRYMRSIHGASMEHLPLMNTYCNSRIFVVRKFSKSPRTTKINHTKHFQNT